MFLIITEIYLFLFRTHVKIQGLIRHSYSEVVKKLTKKVKAENEEILTVKE